MSRQKHPSCVHCFEIGQNSKKWFLPQRRLGAKSESKSKEEAKEERKRNMQRKRKRQQQQIASEGRTRFGSNHFISVNERHQSIPRQTQGVLESQSTELESTSEPQWMGVEAESQCSVVEASPTRSAKRQQRGRQWRLQSKSVGKLDQKKESKAKLFMTWVKGASRDDLVFA